MLSRSTQSLTEEARFADARHRRRPARSGRRRRPSTAVRVARAGAVIAAGGLLAANLSSAAFAENVTRGSGSDPTTLNGVEYECNLRTPQMTVVDGSMAGNVRLFTHPGRAGMDINNGGTPGHWNNAYLVAGVNPAGYDSTRCNAWGHGKSYQFPVAAAHAGPLHVGVIKMHTVAGFAGNGGFDIWLSASRGRALSGAPWTSGHATVTDMQHSRAATEIMVWLNSPGIWRGQYASLGWVRIRTRIWQVLYYIGHSLRHPWNYIVFASPEATSKTTTFTVRNLDLQPLIRFAVRHGWVDRHALLQAIDAGFEWYADPTGGTQLMAYSLTGVR